MAPDMARVVQCDPPDSSPFLQNREERSSHRIHLQTHDIADLKRSAVGCTRRCLAQEWSV